MGERSSGNAGGIGNLPRWVGVVIRVGFHCDFHLRISLKQISTLRVNEGQAVDSCFIFGKDANAAALLSAVIDQPDLILSAFRRVVEICANGNLICYGSAILKAQQTVST